MQRRRAICAFATILSFALVIPGLSATGCGDSRESTGNNTNHDASTDVTEHDSGADAALDAGDGSAKAQKYAYIESNDPTANAVLSFARGEDGRLTPVPNGVFKTSGKGITAGSTQRLGPLDSDQNIALSADKKYLFAVNSGDASIAVFRTAPDGKLTPVTGSPFPSGGKNPVSIGVANRTLYVVNKATDASVAPNYNALHQNDDGSLAPVAQTTVNAPMGGSPSIAYVSPNKRFLFGTEFLDGSRMAQAPSGQIDTFVIAANGALERAGDSPYALPLDTSGMTPPPLPVALNLASHPTQKVLYVGFVTRNQLGVYDYDETGTLSFVTAKSNSGMAISRLLTNAKGTRLYAVDSGSASISVYTIEEAANPKEMGSTTLKSAVSGMPYVDAMGIEQTITSQPFQFALDENEEHLYVVSQRVTTNPGDPLGNYLHTLDLLGDGTLDENAEPIDLRDVGVPMFARPQGVVVY